MVFTQSIALEACSALEGVSGLRGSVQPYALFTPTQPSPSNSPRTCHREVSIGGVCAGSSVTPGRARRLWVTRYGLFLLTFIKQRHYIQRRSGAPRSVVRLKNSMLTVDSIWHLFHPEGSKRVTKVIGCLRSFSSNTASADRCPFEPSAESYP